MPIYEYKCPLCQERKEVLARGDEPPPDCQTCDKPMAKQPSTTSFILRGGGWARDNYGIKRSD